MIEDRILKPIRSAERKLGVKDELTERYRTYGSVRPVRRVADRHRERVRRQPHEERIPHDPPKELQQEIYDEMHGHFALVALDLARSKVINASEIKAEQLPDTSPRSIGRLEFELALHDLAAMLDPDELLALDYLLQGYEGTEVAELMGQRYTTWRKNILESLQMKAECCGFYPHNK